MSHANRPQGKKSTTMRVINQGDLPLLMASAAVQRTNSVKIASKIVNQTTDRKMSISNRPPCVGQFSHNKDDFTKSFYSTWQAHQTLLNSATLSFVDFGARRS